MLLGEGVDRTFVRDFPLLNSKIHRIVKTSWVWYRRSSIGDGGTFRSGPSQHYLGPRKILIADAQQKIARVHPQLLERNPDLALVAKRAIAKGPPAM